MANYRDSIVASFSVDRERHQQDKNEWNCDRVHFFVVRISTAGADGTKFDVNLFRVESIHPSFYNCGLVRNGCRLHQLGRFLSTNLLFVAGLSDYLSAAVFPRYIHNKATVLYSILHWEANWFSGKVQRLFHILISIIMYTVLLVFLCRWVPTMSRCELPTFLSCCRKDWILFFPHHRRPSLYTQDRERRMTANWWRIISCIYSPTEMTMELGQNETFLLLSNTSTNAVYLNVKKTNKLFLFAVR